MNQAINPVHTVWNATVMAKVCIGLTVGRTAKMVSPTRPREVDATPETFTSRPLSCPLLTTAQPLSKRMIQRGMHIHFSKTRSKAVTNAHTLEAQYAWFNPRVKGNSRLSSCGSWPMSRNGPREARNTRMTALARERKRPGSNVPVGDKQYERRRYTKYAGYGRKLGRDCRACL